MQHWLFCFIQARGLRPPLPRWLPVDQAQPDARGPRPSSQRRTGCRQRLSGSAPVVISYFLPDPGLFYSFETGALPLCNTNDWIYYLHPSHKQLSKLK